MKKYWSSLFVVLLTFSFSTFYSMPKIVLEKIVNHTPYALSILDRETDQCLLLEQNQWAIYDYEIQNAQNIVIQGPMLNVMADQAQFMIAKSEDIKLNPDNLPISFLNMCVVPGGIDDGSGIIAGKQGSLVFKLFFANSQGGCCSRSSTLKNDKCSELGITLHIKIDDKNVVANKFCLVVSVELTER